MGVRFVDWAVGVLIPDDFTDDQESWVRRAYEQGVSHGVEKVTEPIVEALRLDERYKQ